MINVNPLEIVKNYDFRFKKDLGQNFLIDENVVNKIIDATEAGPLDTIIEIGSGTGVLTKHLCKSAKKVMAIEVDKGLIKILEDELKEFNNVEILNKSIMAVDLNMFKEERLKIVGNLPYYITSDILYKIIEEGNGFESLTMMMQKEVCDKILSKPCSKTYIPLSVLMQYYYDIKIVESVGPHCFYPKPIVDSMVLNFRKKDDVYAHRKTFIDFILVCFNMRRKTLKNNLKVIEKAIKLKNFNSIEEVFVKLKIDPNERAENLEVIQFYNLFSALL